MNKIDLAIILAALTAVLIICIQSNNAEEKIKEARYASQIENVVQESTEVPEGLNASSGQTSDSTKFICGFLVVLIVGIYPALSINDYVSDSLSIESTKRKHFSEEAMKIVDSL